MERTDTAAALDKGKGSLLTGAPDILWVALGNVLVLLLAADEGFIGFNDLAGTADRASIIAGAHRFADAVRHEPRGLVGAPEHTVDPVRHRTRVVQGTTAPVRVDLGGPPTLQKHTHPPHPTPPPTPHP